MRNTLLTAVFIWLMLFSDDNFFIEEPIVIYKVDLKNSIVIPTLIKLDHAISAYSNNAVNQILGTVAIESNGGHYLVQVGAKSSVGAKGIGQIEGMTHISIWNHFLRYNPKTAKIVRGIAAQHLFDHIFDGEELSQDFMDGKITLKNSAKLDSELIGNLSYNIAICRLVYMIADGPIPSTLEGQANYWKKNYNKTGKGTVDKYIAKYNKYVR